MGGKEIAGHAECDVLFTPDRHVAEAHRIRVDGNVAVGVRAADKVIAGNGENTEIATSRAAASSTGERDATVAGRSDCAAVIQLDAVAITKARASYTASTGDVDRAIGGGYAGTIAQYHAIAAVAGGVAAHAVQRDVASGGAEFTVAAINLYACVLTVIAAFTVSNDVA